MRLIPHEVDAIRRVVGRHFGEGAAVILFGSRVDDSKRGGDIDLLVESELGAEERFRKKLEALTDLQLTLGDRKIDLITVRPGSADEDQPVVRQAREHGVRL